MKEHTLEQITGMETYLKNENAPLIKTELAGRSLEYHLLPQELNEDIPNFIHRVSNKILDKYVISVCEDVPEKLKSYFALGETIEFREHNLDEVDRVIDSEKEVVKILPENLKADYFKLKAQLYRDDIKFYNKYDLQREDFTLEDECEFNKAIKYLEMELDNFSS
jgi:hypothetical protein